MGKKIKKLAKKVGKVATLGIDVKKAAGALSGGIVGENVYGESNPLNSLTGANVRAAAEASARQQAEINKQQEVIRTNAATLAANSTVDNTANVVAGGTAEMSASGDATDIKRRRAQSVSSVLGV